jgi:hypothetical protein
MREHRSLAGTRAGDDEQWPGAFRLTDPMLDRELLLGIELDGRARTNQGERHGWTEPCFLLCSQARWTPVVLLANVWTKMRRAWCLLSPYMLRRPTFPSFLRELRLEKKSLSLGAELQIARLTPIHPTPAKRQFGAFRGVVSVGPEFFEPITDAELTEWE